MKTEKDIEIAFKAAKINAVFNYSLAQTVHIIAGVRTKSIYFHKYTHADKAIEHLKNAGITVREIFGKYRQYNPMNAYFRYFIVIEINN